MFVKIRDLEEPLRNHLEKNYVTNIVLILFSIPKNSINFR